MSRLLNEPVLIGGAIQAVIGFLIIMGWVRMTDAQVGALMIAVNAVLVLVVRALVTPNQLAEHRVDMGGRPTVPLNK